MSQKRKVAIGVTLASVLLLLFTAFSPRWFTGNTYGVKARMGLLGAEACQKDKCEDISWSDFPGDQIDAFRTVAKITFFLTLAAALFMLISAACLWKEKFVFTPMAPSSAALIFLFGAVIMSVFVMQKNPARGYLGTGSSFLIFMLGAAGAFAGTIMIGRERPNDWLGGDNDEDLMPEPPDTPWMQDGASAGEPNSWPDGTGQIPKGE